MDPPNLKILFYVMKSLKYYLIDKHLNYKIITDKNPLNCLMIKIHLNLSI